MCSSHSSSLSLVPCFFFLFFPFALLLLLSHILLDHFPLFNSSTSDISRVLHLTDLHYDPRYHPENLRSRPRRCYLEGGKNGNDEVMRRTMTGIFGSGRCDTPKSLIDFALSEVYRFVPDPNVIVWTGDSGPHSDFDLEFDIEEVIAIMDETSKMLKRMYSDVPVIPVLGNHDFPDGQFPDEFDSFYGRIFEIWQKLGWLDEQQRQSFSRGGYYKRELFGAIFISLNTNLYMNSVNVSYANQEDPTGQIAFLEASLEEAKQSNSVVHLMAHIAPGVKLKRKGTFQWMSGDFNQKLVELLERYAKWIRWALFGHHHIDTFRVLKDPSTDDPLLAMFISPAINTHNRKNNPAFRVFDYSSSSWEMIDAKTYSVNLTELNLRPPPATQFSFEYSMRDQYHLPTDLSAKSMALLAERVRHSDDLFSKYMRFESALWHDQIPAIGSVKRKSRYCALDNVRKEEFDKCMENNNSMSMV